MVHKSKMDAWLVAVLGGTLVFVVALVSAAPERAHALAWLIVSPTIVFILWTMLGTFYRIDGGKLQVRSGPLRWNFEIAELTRIEPTRNPVSSPALSLDRLQLTFGSRGKAVLVSPKNQQAFIADLKANGAQLP